MVVQKDEVMKQFRDRSADRINRHLRQNVESHSLYQTIQELNEGKDFGRMVVDQLITSMEHDSPALFVDFLSWLTTVASSRGLPDTYARNVLDHISEIVREEIPESHKEEIREHLTRVSRNWKLHTIEYSPFVVKENYLGELTLDYLNALLEADRNKARKLIMEAIEDRGISIKDIYIHVFQTVQYELGRLWQLNEITVAQEHYATAVTQMIMSQLYSYIFDNEKKGYQLIAACVGKELHEIGIRMVADIFELEGWDTYYLGANVPSDDIVSEINKKSPQVIALSATMAVNLPVLEDLIAKIRAEKESEGPVIIVGGYPFHVSETLWKDVGADGFGPNAVEAVRIAEKMITND